MAHPRDAPFVARADNPNVPENPGKDKKMMNTQTAVTRPLICPHCEVHELVLAGGYSARCPSCGAFLAGPLLATLRGVTSHPDAVSRHACEGGHPEMRLLPEGVFRCPSCRAEILQVVVEEEGLDDLPLITRMDFGHTDPMFVLPYGVEAEIDCEEKRFSIVEGALVD